MTRTELYNKYVDETINDSEAYYDWKYSDWLEELVLKLSKV